MATAPLYVAPFTLAPANPDSTAGDHGAHIFLEEINRPHVKKISDLSQAGGDPTLSAVTPNVNAALLAAYDAARVAVKGRRSAIALGHSLMSEVSPFVLFAIAFGADLAIYAAAVAPLAKEHFAAWAMAPVSFLFGVGGGQSTGRLRTGLVLGGALAAAVASSSTAYNPIYMQPFEGPLRLLPVNLDREHERLEARVAGEKANIDGLQQQITAALYKRDHGGSVHGVNGQNGGSICSDGVAADQVQCEKVDRLLNGIDGTPDKGLYGLTCPPNSSQREVESFRFVA